MRCTPPRRSLTSLTGHRVLRGPRAGRFWQVAKAINPHTPRPFSKNGENPAPDYFSLIMANDLLFPPPRFFYFLQCIIESPHVSICSSELRQIQHSLVRPQNVISTQQVGFNPTLRHSSTSVCTAQPHRRTAWVNFAFWQCHRAIIIIIIVTVQPRRCRPKAHSLLGGLTLFMRCSHIATMIRRANGLSFSAFSPGFPPGGQFEMLFLTIKRVTPLMPHNLPRDVVSDSVIVINSFRTKYVLQFLVKRWLNEK